MSVEAEAPQNTPAGDPHGARATPSEPGGWGPRRVLPWIGGVVVVAVIAVIAIVALGGGDSKDAKNGGAARAAHRAPATAVSLAQLGGAERAVGHVVYWAGPQAGAGYELSQTQDGRAFVRYLPAGVRAGDLRASFRTVGSYPQRDALRTLEATARAQGVAPLELPGGGRAFQDARRATSAYAAFPGADVQVEVFDPRPGEALALIRAGRIAPVRALPSGAPPRAVTEAQLKAFAAIQGVPVYWAGPRARMTYALTQTADGRIYVRYLPAGTALDDRAPSYLTVGSYPQPDARATLAKTAARQSAPTFDLDRGGLGAVLAVNPDSVYLAYPGENVQVELFDPQGRATALAQDRAIVPVR
ncbi:MAG TPA: hypothetical protein VGM91_21295 [Conexibacter sp.]|jgi:nucleotide-binding universal stress UspA family protein